MKYTKPRGTEDWLPETSEKYRSMINMLFFITSLSGYHEIQTPIFERSELFIRSVGETSDIVKKEFYAFKDKGDRDMVLRPEGTAGVIRAIVEAKMLNKLPSPIKLSYTGPMFRYERPQSGRLRQFHQFGVECINTKSIADDVDLLLMVESILTNFGLKNYEILINNIGNFEARGKWIAELRQYFQPYKGQLSELSQTRIDTNPLRILDDKEDGPKEFVKNAPKIDKFLTEKEKDNFNTICKILKLLNIKFTVDPTLVRGLDYYTNFIFEVNATDERLKGQPTIVGGGRYAHLVAELGGEDCSCIGFALGIERLALALEYENQELQLPLPKTIDVVVANLDAEIDMPAVFILQYLRASGIAAVCKFSTHKLVKCFEYAEALQAKFVVIVSERDIAENKLTIKDQRTLRQEVVEIDKISAYIKERI